VRAISAPPERPETWTLHALGAGAHRAGQRALHRAPEGDAVLELLGDRLGDELGVELGPLDLEDVDLDRLAGHPVQVAAQGVDLEPDLPITMPGRAVWMFDLDLVGVLADRDVDRPAWRACSRCARGSHVLGR
jgi:hypothetical protein